MEVKYNLIYKTEYMATADLDPKDFTECYTVEDLYSHVSYKLHPRHIDQADWIDEEIDIPQKFIDEWKKQVNFIKDNVMSEQLKERLINLKDVYTEKYTGEYLNNNKYNHHGVNPFDYRYYYNFNFEPKATYKCYMKDSEDDYYGHYSTTLLYAEKTK